MGRLPLMRGMKTQEAQCQDLEARGYTFLGQGNTRKGYLSPNGRWVVKVPLNEPGLMDNEVEAFAWCRRDYSRTPVRLARCRLAGHLLVMEAVDVEAQADLDWVGLIDCQQVGRNRSGDIVAYDYA